MTLTDNCEIKAALKKELKAAINLPVGSLTIKSRADVANKCFQMISQLYKSLKEMVFHRHLQIQGWKASLATIDDCALHLSQNLESANKILDEYLCQRDDMINTIDSCDDYKAIMYRIPV